MGIVLRELGLTFARVDQRYIQAVEDAAGQVSCEQFIIQDVKVGISFIAAQHFIPLYGIGDLVLFLEH